jgi:hypothetical protein
MEIFVLDSNGSFFKLLTDGNPYQPNCLVKVHTKNSSDNGWIYLGDTTLTEKLQSGSFIFIDGCTIQAEKIHYNAL